MASLKLSRIPPYFDSRATILIPTKRADDSKKQKKKHQQRRTCKAQTLSLCLQRHESHRKIPGDFPSESQLNQQHLRLNIGGRKTPERGHGNTEAPRCFLLFFYLEINVDISFERQNWLSSKATRPSLRTWSIYWPWWAESAFLNWILKCIQL